MPRLFTGIKIPATISEQLSLIQYGLPNARWIAPEDFHITLRFIGDIEDHIAADLADSLSQLSFSSFQLHLKSVGVFGKEKPRMVWAGVAPSEPLERLQLTHEQLSQRLGLKAEGRKFTPHVTLARFKSGQRDDVAPYLIDHARFQSTVFEVTSFELYSARTSKGGGPYVIEQSYDVELI